LHVRDAAGHRGLAQDVLDPLPRPRPRRRPRGRAPAIALTEVRQFVHRLRAHHPEQEASMSTRKWTNTLALGATLALTAVPALAQTVGVTATEIKLGNTNPYSGSASAYGTIGKVIAAYFKKVNDEGGINGRKVNFITYDDGYSPPKTVEMVRRLVEQDQVA